MEHKPISFKNPEAEFSSKDVLDLESIDLMPQNEKTPIPVLFAPGWGFTPETLKESFSVLVEEGRRVISLGHSRNSLNLNSEKHNPAELQKAYALLSLIEKKNIEKVDAVAHSEGAINLVIAAIEHPEKFRNIVFVNPAGMVGKNTFHGHIFKFYTEVFQDFKASLKDRPTFNSVATEYKEITKYFLSNPTLSLKEVVAISETDVLQMLEGLKKQGIGISVIAGVDDKIFPMQKMQKKLSSSLLHGFYSVAGGHNEIILQPKKYMGAIDAALDSLEQRAII